MRIPGDQIVFSLVRRDGEPSVYVARWSALTAESSFLAGKEVQQVMNELHDLLELKLGIVLADASTLPGDEENEEYSHTDLE